MPTGLSGSQPIGSLPSVGPGMRRMTSWGPAGLTTRVEAPSDRRAAMKAMTPSRSSSTSPAVRRASWSSSHSSAMGWSRPAAMDTIGFEASPSRPGSRLASWSLAALHLSSELIPDTAHPPAISEVASQVGRQNNPDRRLVAPDHRGAQRRATVDDPGQRRDELVELPVGELPQVAGVVRADQVDRPGPLAHRAHAIGDPQHDFQHPADERADQAAHHPLVDLGRLPARRLDLVAGADVADHPRPERVVIHPLRSGRADPQVDAAHAERLVRWYTASAPRRPASFARSRAISAGSRFGSGAGAGVGSGGGGSSTSSSSTWSSSGAAGGPSTCTRAARSTVTPAGARFGSGAGREPSGGTGIGSAVSPPAAAGAGAGAGGSWSEP